MHIYIHTYRYTQMHSLFISLLLVLVSVFQFVGDWFILGNSDVKEKTRPCGHLYLELQDHNNILAYFSFL